MLAGCSAGVTSAQPEATSTPTPTKEASTVAQWASLIAQQKAEWDEWSDTWEENSCSGVTASSSAGLLCRLQLTSATFIAETTTIEHQLAVTPGKKGFIATEPPAEVASLFEQTKAAAESVKDSADAWDAGGCSSSTAGDCASLSVTFDRSIGSLAKAFVGWTPYM